MQRDEINSTAARLREIVTVDAGAKQITESYADLFDSLLPLEGQPKVLAKNIFVFIAFLHHLNFNLIQREMLDYLPIAWYLKI